MSLIPALYHLEIKTMICVSGPSFVSLVGKPLKSKAICCIAAVCQFLALIVIKRLSQALLVHCLCTKYLLWFHECEMCLQQVWWMPELVTWLSTLCCFVVPSEGHVELIHGEPHPLFISDPVLCQLDGAPCMCGSRESVVKIYLIWPFFSSSKCSCSQKLP